MNSQLKRRAGKIKALALDVDGVLTNGLLYLDSEGRELKAFSTRDGLGLRAFINSGLEIFIISGRQSEAVNIRAKDLGIAHVYQNIIDKLTLLKQLCGQLNFTLDEVAYMGDDLNDLECLTSVGLALAPSDAAEDIKNIVHFISQYPGGQGAVRQACELILRAQNLWKIVS